MYFKKVLVFLLFSFSSVSFIYSQQARKYDLLKLEKKHKLEITASYPQLFSSDPSVKKSINVRGILWLKDVLFETGKIDVDIRGRNVFLQSFPGIAFHAKDTSNYDVVYFCPFRFHDTTEETRKYSVKYMSFPDYSYTKLRKEHPGVYENEVTPAPASGDWFHATIVVEKEQVAVYVNHSTTPSLKVQRLPTLSSGKIGLWSFSETLSSDFANLVITK